MVTRPHGFRNDTRKRLRKKVRERGKLSITKALMTYEIGDKVAIVVEPAYQKGLPHRRYFGNIGKVEGKRGNSYIIGVKIGNATKKIICPPIHLKKI